MAHDLHSEVSPQDVTTLEQSLCGVAALAYAEVKPDGDASERLEIWLFTVLMVLESWNMMNEYETVNAEALRTYHLVKAIHQQLGHSRMPEEDEELMKTHGVPPPPNPINVWENYVEGPDVRFRLDTAAEKEEANSGDDHASTESSPSASPG